MADEVTEVTIEDFNIAIAMWEVIKKHLPDNQCNWYYVIETKKKFLSLFDKSWVHGCLLCEIYLRDKCSKECPLAPYSKGTSKVLCANKDSALDIVLNIHLPLIDRQHACDDIIRVHKQERGRVLHDRILRHIKTYEEEYREK